MRTIDEWLDAYGDSHQNPINETIHRIAVPIIVLDVLGFLHAVPTARSRPGCRRCRGSSRSARSRSTRASRRPRAGMAVLALLG